MRWFVASNLPARAFDYPFVVNTIGVLEHTRDIEHWVQVTYRPQLRNGHADLLRAIEGRSAWDGAQRQNAVEAIDRKRANELLLSTKRKAHWFERQLSGKIHPWIFREFKIMNEGVSLIGCDALDHPVQPEPFAGWCGAEVTDIETFQLLSLAIRPWQLRST